MQSLSSGDFLKFNFPAQIISRMAGRTFFKIKARAVAGKPAMDVYYILTLYSLNVHMQTGVGPEFIGLGSGLGRSVWAQPFLGF
jgi:hypothetical protein